jgi:hypothetical protein
MLRFWLMVAAGLAAGCLVAPSAGAFVSALYTYRAVDCAERSDPLTLRFWGPGLNDPDVNENADRVVQRIEARLFPRSGNVGGGIQYTLDGDHCTNQAVSLGREFGPSRSFSNGDHYGHREKKHLRLFNTHEDGERTVYASPHRERKMACTPSADGSYKTSDVVYRRYNGIDGFDAEAREQASVLRRGGYDVIGTSVELPAPTVFVQCNQDRVVWSGDVYVVRVP